MFVGGGSASTAGGIKVTTFAVLLLAILAEARGDQDIEAFGRRITPSTVRLSVAVAFIGSSIIGLATLLLLQMTNLSLDRILFEVISAFATVGLSTGITPSLPDGAKYVIVALMFVGRVGTMTAASALALRERRRVIPDARGQPDDRLTGAAAPLTSDGPVPGTGERRRELSGSGPLWSEQLPESGGGTLHISTAGDELLDDEAEGDALDEGGELIGTQAAGDRPHPLPVAAQADKTAVDVPVALLDQDAHLGITGQLPPRHGRPEAPRSSDRRRQEPHERHPAGPPLSRLPRRAADG